MFKAIRHFTYVVLVSTFGWVSSVNADVLINEVLGSTSSNDNEYIELYNTGPGVQNISGWTITLYDSDDGSSFGGLDGGSPFTVPDGTILEVNQYFLFANQIAQTAFGVSADVLLGSNAIENSSYTIVLRDNNDNVINTIFVRDDDVNDQANIDGNTITPDLTFGPNGTFLPAGFFRTTDGGNELGLLEFSPQPSESGTPGTSNQMSGQVSINEVLGSTTSTDNEYVELFNAGPSSEDISGWTITLYDSDAGGSFGGIDGGSPYTVPANTILEANQFYLFANASAESSFEVTADSLLPANAIENSSYTIVLSDANDNIINTIFVNDGGSGDTANIAGNTINADLTFGPDGTFLPAGFFRTEDGGNQLALLEFSPQPSPSGTPGASNVLPDPATPNPFSIPEIQGAAHTSPLLDESITTTGIVTAVDSNGFYLQDPAGDGDIATSDAIFVFSGSAPGVNIGDELEVSGMVTEFTPGGVTTRNLSTTQISEPVISTLSTENPLPSPVILGDSGRVPPSENIDDDAFTSFDPTTDGIDFFESLEAMRVTIEDAVAISNTNQFGEIFSVANFGSSATGISNRGTLNISPNDFNPEKIQIDEDTGILDFEFPDIATGATLGNVTGVIGYSFGNFEVLVTEDFTANQEFADSELQIESSLLVGNEDEITIASYNVLNLETNDNDGDADVANGRFDTIATQIVNNLNTPDIIGLQEIQDNTGSIASDGVTAADVTLQALVDAIIAAGGPAYAFIDSIVPEGAVGGQPGGNIRVAYLYNPARLSLVPDSVLQLNEAGATSTNPGVDTFFNSRIPLVASFVFNSETVTVVNNHFSSKGGSAPIFGREQPFQARQEETEVNGSLDERQDQATAVNTFVASILDANPDANIVVLGDLNEFEFVSPVSTILGENLTNLTDSLPENERYTFNFQGNSQSLDHILVSSTLLDGAQFDIVHINSEFAATDQRASDHDPLLVSLTLSATSTEGDIDADGDVDFDDFRLLIRALRSVEGSDRYLPAADLDNSGRIDAADARVLIALLRAAS